MSEAKPYHILYMCSVYMHTHIQHFTFIYSWPFYTFKYTYHV